MRFRWPRRLYARLRDVGLLALLADHLITGLGSWLALTAGLAIAGAVTLIMATAATTQAKAAATEQRLNALVPVVGALKSGAGTIPDTARNLVNVSTGLPQNVPSSSGGTVYTGGFNSISSNDFSGAVAHASGTVNAHNHGIGHNHAMGHDHLLQLEANFNAMVNEVQNMRQVLVNAGIG